VRTTLTPRWPAFRHRSFRIFFAGQLASLIGTSMQQAAQLWLAYQMTGSASLVGVIGFATQGPIFLLGALGGVVSDAFDRKRVLLVTQGLSMLLALVLAALTLPVPALHWDPHIRVSHLVAIALLLGIVNAFDVPTRQAFLTDMVGRSDLISAVALNSSMFHASRIVGPALGGFVITAVGEGGCFALNALSFLAVLASLIAIRLDPRPAGAGRARRRLVDGIRYAYANRAVRSLLLLLGLVSLTGAPYFVLLPVFAKSILHLDARGLGLLMGAAGAGSLTGALRLSVRSHTRGLRRTVALSATVAGLGLLALSQSHALWPAVIALVPIGFGLTSQLASTNTLVQTNVPDAMRGRVVSVYAMMFMGLMPFGALLAGAVAQRIGVSATVAAGGTACLIGAAVFAGFGWEALRLDSGDTATAEESPVAAPRR
jgi:MFS family permease